MANIVPLTVEIVNFYYRFYVKKWVE